MSRYTKTQLKTLLTPAKNISSRECVVCKTSSNETSEKDFIDSKLEVCETCYNLFKIGENLVKNDIKVVISNTRQPYSLKMPSLNHKEKYMQVTTNSIDNNTDRVYVINDRQIGTKYATKLFVGNYCSKKDGKTADFNELLKNNKGINRLAVLRCDVDNLGQTFVNGLSDEYSTISRTTSLSRQLSLFFKFYINNICKSKISGEADEEMRNFSLDDGDVTLNLYC